MTAFARGVFAILVVATFGAFFVAQRLKNAPSVVQRFRATPVFSPNSDGRKDRAAVSFLLKRSDDVTVAMVDDRGDEVRELMSGQRLPAYTKVATLRWDGRDEQGRRVADGVYRARITLQQQGRSIVMPRAITLDVTPPRPLVTSIGPDAGPRPEILPRPGAATDVEIRLRAEGRRLEVPVWRMAPGRPELVVSSLPVSDGAATVRWDGTIDGRPAPAGTYLVGVRVRDQAGNIGTSPALGPGRFPDATYGERLPGRGGVTVRYLGVAPPATPTAVGEVATFGVDARSKRFRWSLRRVGTSEVVRRGAGTRGGALRIRAPGRESGVYLLEVRTRTRTARVPFAVQGERRRGVLVVLPVMTWQGRNAVDDDGDGLPNVLDQGVGVKLDRVYAGDGLPAGFARREAPLLAWLARTGRRFDVTTDAALAAGRGPRPERHSGVLLPGDVRWLPRATQARLRRYVRRGGTVASLGVDSLRRLVSISRRGRLVEPTPPADTDLFGARVRPLQAQAEPITLTESADRIDLFSGTEGQFGGWTRVEEISSLTPGVGLLSSAVTEIGRPVIMAARLGRGVVVRFGLPELPARLSSDPQIEALIGRTWTLLSR